MKNNMVQQAFNTIWIHTQEADNEDDWGMQKKSGTDQYKPPCFLKDISEK
jgi:hypothetical protein